MNSEFDGCALNAAGITTGPYMGISILINVSGENMYANFFAQNCKLKYTTRPLCGVSIAHFANGCTQYG